jgi:hypothetical protein
MMKIETETVHKVDYKELEKLVHETYGFEPEMPKWTQNRPEFKDNKSLLEWPYSFVAIEQCGNDSSHEFYVDGKLDDSDQEELDEWVESGGKKWIFNSAVLNDLCKQGIIPAGNYIVRVSW